MVVGASARHPLQRVHSHLTQRGIRPKLGLLQQQQDRVGLRELGRVSETPVLGVVGGGDRTQDRVDHSVRQRRGTPRDAGASPLARLEDASRDLRLVGPVVRRDTHERIRHLVRWQVGGARKDVA